MHQNPLGAFRTSKVQPCCRPAVSDSRGDTWAAVACKAPHTIPVYSQVCDCCPRGATGFPVSVLPCGSKWVYILQSYCLRSSALVPKKHLLLRTFVDPFGSFLWELEAVALTLLACGGSSEIPQWWCGARADEGAGCQGGSSCFVLATVTLTAAALKIMVLIFLHQLSLKKISTKKLQRCLMNYLPKQTSGTAWKETAAHLLVRFCKSVGNRCPSLLRSYIVQCIDQLVLFLHLIAALFFLS